MAEWMMVATANYFGNSFDVCTSLPYPRPFHYNLTTPRASVRFL